MSLDGNCDKYDQINLIFAQFCLLVLFCVCWVGIGYFRLHLRYSLLGVVACLLQGVAGVLQGFCSFIQQGLAELTKILGPVVHTGDCTAQFIPNTFYGVGVWRSHRLLHLGDFALLKEIKNYPSMVRCSVIVLIAIVMPEMLPGKWH